MTRLGMYPVWNLESTCTSIMSLFFLSISVRPFKFVASGFILLFKLDAWNCTDMIFSLSKFGWQVSAYWDFYPSPSEVVTTVLSMKTINVQLAETVFSISSFKKYYLIL